MQLISCTSFWVARQQDCVHLNLRARFSRIFCVPNFLLWEIVAGDWIEWKEKHGLGASQGRESSGETLRMKFDLKCKDTNANKYLSQNVLCLVWPSLINYYNQWLCDECTVKRSDCSIWIAAAAQESTICILFHCDPNIGQKYIL